MNEGRKGKIKNVLCCLQNEVSPMRFYYSLGSLLLTVSFVCRLYTSSIIISSHCFHY